MFGLFTYVKVSANEHALVNLYVSYSPIQVIVIVSFRIFLFAVIFSI